MRCFDDIPGQVLPWSVVRQAREQKLERFQHLGVRVREKLMKRSAPKKIQSSSSRHFVRTPPMVGIERRIVDPSKSQRRILNYTHRRVSCSLSWKGAVVTSGEVAK